MFVSWHILKCFEVKVHETLAMFSNASETRVVQAIDYFFVAIDSRADKGVRDIVLPIHGRFMILSVVYVRIG